MNNSKKIFGITNLFYSETPIENADDLQEADLKPVRECTSLSFEEELEEYVNEIKEEFRQKFEITCELAPRSAQALHELIKEETLKRNPWMQRNFVKETITHKVEW